MNNKRLNVLLISPLPEDLIGGISFWTSHILSFYQKKDNSNVQIQQYFGRNVIPIHTGDSLLKRLYRGFRAYIPMYFAIKKILKSNGYDIFHLCSSGSISLVKDFCLLHLAKKMGVKSVLHFHFGRIPDLYSKSNWEYKLLIMVVKQADCTIVLDKRSFDILYKITGKKIYQLPNPLSNGVIALKDKYKEIERRKRTILFVGHVILTKGVFELVRACKQIDNIELEIVGFVNNETKEALLEEAGEKSESWLRILGEQNHSTIIKYMLSSSVFVLPTYTEGFPNVVLEAMACGCPIVATNVGAIPEMLNIKNVNTCGLCVSPKDVEALKISINKMLTDVDFAKSCIMNSQKRVKEMYSLLSVCHDLENIWFSLMSKSLYKL